MSTQATVIFVVIALLAGAAIGFAISRLLAAAKLAAKDQSLSDRETQVSELKTAVESERHLATEDRGAATTKLEALQNELNQVIEARAKLDGASESLEALKEQLEEKSKEITAQSEDGKLRADAIVNLPKGRRLVIDAKNLWDGYQQAVTATGETARQLLLQKHVQAVRQQVRQLSAKAYWQQYDGLDCVVMFLPSEAMFQSALEQDKDLLNDATASRVYLASPMTLVGLLRAVQYVLDQERLNQNALEISEIGKKLYDSLHTFGSHYAKVGSNLRRTVDTYNESIGSLERNVLSKARQLRSKGIGSTAILPEPDAIAAMPAQMRSTEFTQTADRQPTVGIGSLEFANQEPIAVVSPELN